MLFISSESPFSARYESFLEIARKAAREEKTGVLFIQDACIAATLDEYCRKIVAEGVNLYVLKEDCEARGFLGRVHSNVKVVDYEGLVKLVTEEYKRIVS